MLPSEWGNSRSSIRRYLRVAAFWPGPSDAPVSPKAILIGRKVNGSSEDGNSVGLAWDEDPSRSDVGNDMAQSTRLNRGTSLALPTLTSLNRFTKEKKKKKKKEYLVVSANVMTRKELKLVTRISLPWP